MAVRDLGLESAKPCATLGVKAKAEEINWQHDNSPRLSAPRKKLYRSVTMRFQYLGQDRPEVQYATKEAARHMEDPSEYDMSNLGLKIPEA